MWATTNAVTATWPLRGFEPSCHVAITNALDHRLPARRRHVRQKDTGEGKEEEEAG